MLTVSQNKLIYKETYYFCLVVILKQPHPAELKAILFFTPVNVSLSSVTDYLHRQGSEGKMGRSVTMVILRNRGGNVCFVILTVT
jgi:hypothetical protein